MKRFAALAILGLGLAATPALADEPLAGASLFAVSHGQPFCTSRAQLQRVLDAQVAQAPLNVFSFPGCTLVEDNRIVVVGQDDPGGRYMHMVRARADVFPLGVIEGYTFSVGLYGLPVRSTLDHLNPFF